MTTSTILTTQIFQQYNSNYQLNFASTTNLLNGTIGVMLPNIILEVEVNLNAQLRGRLYATYQPYPNTKMTGINNLTPQVEQNTLYLCLVKCVQYKLLTGEYVNLNNTFTGNIAGTNNFSASNSNIIALRNDIRDMLKLLGLYSIGSFENVVPTSQTPTTNNLTPKFAYEILQLITNTNLTFNNTISFPYVDKLLIDNQPITTWLDNQFFNELQIPLTNYKQNNTWLEIPFITSVQVSTWTTANTSLLNLLSSYVNNDWNITNTLPLITSADIERWNSTPTDSNFEVLQNQVNTNTANLTGLSASVQTNTNNLNTNTKASNFMQNALFGSAIDYPSDGNEWWPSDGITQILTNYCGVFGSDGMLGSITAIPQITQSQVSQITTNQNDISTNTSNISKNTNAIASVKLSVTANAEAISNLQSTIKPNQAHNFPTLNGSNLNACGDLIVGSSDWCKWITQSLINIYAYNPSTISGYHTFTTPNGNTIYVWYINGGNAYWNVPHTWTMLNGLKIPMVNKVMELDSTLWCGSENDANFTTKSTAGSGGWNHTYWYYKTNGVTICCNPLWSGMTNWVWIGIFLIFN